MNRKKFLIIYFIFFIILSSSIYFGLKFYSKKKFNEQVLNQLIVGKSKFRDTTTDLCRYQSSKKRLALLCILVPRKQQQHR